MHSDCYLVFSSHVPPECFLEDDCISFNNLEYSSGPPHFDVTFNNICTSDSLCLNKIEVVLDTSNLVGQEFESPSNE